MSYQQDWYWGIGGLYDVNKIEAWRVVDCIVSVRLTIGQFCTVAYQ